MYSSLRLGLISLIPNILPALVVFAAMVLMGMDLNPATITVTVVALGIAVDDTIHLLVSYTKARKLTSDNKQAVLCALSSQVRPVITTSLALILSFLVFRFSEFSAVADFGLLCAIALATAMLADLVITPILLRYIRIKG